jgi:hypothetical protein
LHIQQARDHSGILQIWKMMILTWKTLLRYSVFTSPEQLAVRVLLGVARSMHHLGTNPSSACNWDLTLSEIQWQVSLECGQIGHGRA